MNELTYIVVQPDGSVTEATLSRESNAELRTFQQIVGGYLEGVYSADMSIAFFCNDEGKINGLPTNTLATELWWHFNPLARTRDHLCGPVIITGGPDLDGETTDVPQVVLNRVKGYGRGRD